MARMSHTKRFQVSQTPLSRPPAFVFTEETSHLDDDEYARICEVLRQAESVVDYRRNHLAGVSPAQPANNWDTAKPQSKEIDGRVFNHFTSYELIQTKDRDVVRKLLLYAQSFSGYQLATWYPAHSRPWIHKKLPENIDDLLRLILIWPDEIFELYKATILATTPAELRVPLPWRFGNVGWEAGEVLVNLETFRYHNHLRLLGENDVIRRLREASGTHAPFILEIGSGYGALVYCLSVLFPTARFVLVDLPECLAFSAAYLAVTRPDVDHQFAMPTPEGEIDIPATPGFTYLANYLVDRTAKPVRYDLSINTSSLTEMTDEQIETYARYVVRHSTPSSIFYERNTHVSTAANEMSRLQKILSSHFSRMTECRSIVQLLGSTDRAFLWQT